jgi:diguanylate cyclase (GGDEF)-like protein
MGLMSRFRLSVSTRFMLVLAIGILFQACISFVSLVKLRQSMLSNRTAGVKHLVETAYSTVDFYHDQAARGLMTDVEAREAARNAVRAMRYDGDNYFFIWTMDGVGVAHGSHPEWEGKNVLQSPEKENLPVVSYMVAQLIAVCKSENKEGSTSYKIPKPGQRTPVNKISYTRLFEPWGWSIGTGVYTDDIDARFRTETFSILRISSLLIAIAGLLTFFLGRNLSRALSRLTVQVSRVARGEFDGEVPGTRRTDEVGVMARALLVLRDNSRDAVELRLDQLTGLPSRKLLMDRIKQAMAASVRSGCYGGVMLIDLDKFKTLNDTQGHDVGDMLLREVADRLSACVRDVDTVARLGGDEFVVVAVDVGKKEEEAAATAESIGEKLLAALNQPFKLGSISHETSGSVGISLFKGNAASVDDLLKQADLAMYKSKDHGRNTCSFFDPYMEASVRERAALEADMRAALHRNQFQLYYQPQVGEGDRLIGAEALLRWHHPLRGMVMPNDFIPLAEESGLILPLGQWVLEAACRQLALWAKRPETAGLKISVNVSSRQFQRPDFVELLLATLEQTGANPQCLDLELTESLMVENVDDIIAKMEAVQEHGVSFSLDDFGTGYSSLSYLKRMPLDKLKIDRSFVRDVLTDPNDAAIAKTIVALTFALGLGVIAEGVETAEQRDFLNEIGCHSFQGYFFSRPLALDGFEEFVRHTASLKNSSPVFAA